MSLQIETAAIIMSVQDSGRNGFLRFGLPHSGPMDWWAFRAANLLVANPPDCACVEIGMTGCSIRMESDALLAVCGAGYHLFRNQQEVPLWMSFLTQPGDQLTLEKCAGGNWVYLAACGGIQSDAWLGSRSVYPRGNLGRYLQDGDQLPVERLSPQARTLSGRRFPISLRPAYTQPPLLRVVQGPDVARFQDNDYQRFFDATYQVSPQMDRMGYRLRGPAIMHRDGADIISRGMAMGEIQVPGGGQPIVMMADHPTAGGYTSMGTISKVDLPLLAQSQPEHAKIRFTHVNVADAHNLIIKCLEEFDSRPFEEEDIWLNL